MAPQLNFSDSDGSSFDKVSSRFASIYSDSAEKLNEITKLLRHCGIERVVPPLPKIAVIGNQSAGKSSLIEAISKIKVPRSKGTTTRCPMEVILRTSHVDGWSCAISVRLEDVGRAPETVNLARVESHEEVPLLIRRAQLAVLNPGRDPKMFLDLDIAQCKTYPCELPFSRNMVVVEITKADDDVTFIDLPGLISNPSNVFALFNYRY
jgi:Dynamin family